MAKMLLAAFSDYEQANRAVTHLEDAGYGTDNISVITTENKKEGMKEVSEKTEDVAQGAVSGATTGGVIGGLTGLLAGVGVVPALAGLFIGGPIAAALGATGVAATAISGVVTGAGAGGLLGALTGLGVNEDTAKSYDETVNNGGYLLAVAAEEEKADAVRDIFDENGAENIATVDAH